MSLYSATRDDRQIYRLLQGYDVNITRDAVQAWTHEQAESVERWLTAMLGISRRDGLCIKPIPSALYGYVHGAKPDTPPCSYGHRCPTPNTCTINQSPGRRPAYDPPAMLNQERPSV